MKRSGIATARKLRKSSTEAEAILWAHLRNRRLDGLKFRRQVPIAGYIADFACIEPKIVIEVDGSQHADDVLKDAARTAALDAAGFILLRFWNNDVSERIDAVLQTIHDVVMIARDAAPELERR